MRILLYLTLLLGLFGLARVFGGDGAVSPWDTLRTMYRKTAPPERPKMLSRFLGDIGRGGCPLQHGTTLVFLFESRDAAAPVIVGDFTGWEQGAPMERFEDTSLYSYTMEDVPRGARLEYKFKAGGREHLDPRNRSSVDNGVGGRNSVAVMPGYVPFEYDGKRHHRMWGRVRTFDFTGVAVRGSRKVSVYTPPGYDREVTARYPTLYVHDGQSYLKRADAASLADYLITKGKMAKAILVFVDPVDRRTEYRRDKAFTTLITDELVPYIDRNWRTLAEPSSRAVLGASMGGLVAVHLAFERPDVFGMAASQSGAFGLGGGLLDEIEKAPKKNIVFYADVGLYDLRYGKQGLLDDGRALRGTLTRKGYPLYYYEFPGGHNWTCWRDQLPSILPYLFRKK